MKAIILAAGRGSRMKGLTDANPKCLLKLYGKSLIEWQIFALRDAGIDQISIVTGYKRESLADLGLKKFYNPRWAETNMVSSLECANEWLQEGPCIVTYSDIFYSRQAVESLINCDAVIAVTYDANWLDLWKRRFGDPLLDAETFRVNQEGELVEIGGKPKSVQEIEGQYMGLLRFTPKGWSEIIRIRSNLLPDECDKMHMTGTLQRVIDESHVAISAFPYYGEWGEIDSESDLSSYNNLKK